MHMHRTNDHDRRQAEQERRRHRIEQTAWLYRVPRDLAAVMSGEVLRLAEEHVQRESPAESSPRESRGYQGYLDYKERMIAALRHITEDRSADEEPGGRSGRSGTPSIGRPPRPSWSRIGGGASGVRPWRSNGARTR
jgi:hypothetical protein